MTIENRGVRYPVEQLDPVTGKVLATYPSLKAAARAVSCGAGSLSMVTRGVGGNMRPGGFDWRLVSPNKKEERTVKQAEAPKKIVADNPSAPELLRRSQAVSELLKLAIDEEGFTPGLLGCIRARAAALVADLLALTPVASPAAVPAPTKPTEKPIVLPRVVHYSNIRSAPRPFLWPDDRLVRMSLALSLQGKTDREIEEVLGISAGMVYKLRTRSPYAAKHHRTVDAWFAQNPGAQVKLFKRRTP